MRELVGKVKQGGSSAARAQHESRGKMFVREVLTREDERAAERSDVPREHVDGYVGELSE